MDSESAFANVLEILVPTGAGAGLLALVSVAWLKGHWWMGVAGALVFIVGFVSVFGALGVGEPSPEFRETLVFQVLNVVLNAALYGGFFLMAYGAARSARTDSWWDRRR